MRALSSLLLSAAVLSSDAFRPCVQGQDDWDARGEPKAVPQFQRFEMPAEQFDQWIFGDSRAGEPRRKLETQLTLQVEAVDLACHLSDAQKQKLRLAGRGDMQRFLESTEVARKKFEAVRRDQNAFGQVWQEIQPLQTKFNSGIFGPGSLFRKVLQTTLDAGQFAHWDQQEAARRKFRYHGKIGLIVAALESGIPLRDEQRRKFIQVLQEETRPPQQFGQYDYYVVLLQAAKLDEGKLKPIFDDAQWRALRQLFGQMKGMETHLKNNGALDGL